MSKPKLTDQDYCRAAAILDCEVAAIKAVAETESRGKAFYDDGFPVILFERHIFRKYTKGKYNASHPHLSGPAGNYGKAGQNQRNKFNEAFKLNADAAMKACSWGAFQIMGFNHEICGYSTVGAFVDAMKESEGKQLDAFVGFVDGNHLDDEIRELDWAGFAKGYNGPLYKQNKYDTKMAAAYKRYSKQNVDCSNSAAIPQAPTNSPSELIENQTEPAIAPPIQVDVKGDNNEINLPDLGKTADAVQQQMPRITTGARWLGSLGLGGGFATITGALAGMPPWAVFLLGVLTAVLFIGLIWLFVKYYGKVFALVNKVVDINADPTTPNVQLVSRKEGE